MVIPPHHELRRRAALRAKDMGKMVPDEAVNAMKGEGHGLADDSYRLDPILFPTALVTVMEP